MPIMEDRQLYHSMSRKELQKLCKKLGLPARKPSSVMAESLRPYFQKRDGQCSKPTSLFGGSLSSSAPSEESDAPLCSYNGPCPDGSQLCYDEGNKLNMLIRMENLDELRNGSLNSFQPELVCKCIERIVTMSGDLTSKAPCICEINSQSRKGSVSIEFCAASEEGIKICVDLNSKPLEWIKKYNKQVKMCENMYVKKRKLNVNSCANNTSGGERDLLGPRYDSLSPSSPCPESIEARHSVSGILDSDKKAENFCQNEIPREKTACNFKDEGCEHPRNQVVIGNSSLESRNCVAIQTMELEVSEAENFHENLRSENGEN